MRQASMEQEQRHRWRRPSRAHVNMEPTKAEQPPAHADEGIVPSLYCSMHETSSAAVLGREAGLVETVGLPATLNAWSYCSMTSAPTQLCADTSKPVRRPIRRCDGFPRT